MVEELPISGVANKFNTLCSDINYQTSNKYKIELDAAFANLSRLKHHDNQRNFKWFYGKYDEVREKITSSRFVHLAPFTTVRKKKIYSTYLKKKWNFPLNNVSECSLFKVSFEELTNYTENINSFYSRFNYTPEKLHQDYMESSLKAICKDVNRSGFVDTEHNITSDDMKDAITTTLVSFVVMEPNIGYIQGLNFIACFLLTFFDQTETLELLLVLFENKGSKHRNFDFGSLYKDGFPLLMSIERSALYYLVKYERKLWRAIKHGTQQNKVERWEYLKEKSKYKKKQNFETHVDIKIMFSGGILTLFTNMFDNLFGYVFFDFIIIEGNVALVKLIISVLIFNKENIVKRTDDSFNKISTPEFFEVIQSIKYMDKNNMIKLLSIYKRLKIKRII